MKTKTINEVLNDQLAELNVRLDSLQTKFDRYNQEKAGMTPFAELRRIARLKAEASGLDRLYVKILDTCKTLVIAGDIVPVKVQDLLRTYRSPFGGN